ncbi:MAG: DNA primase [Spirochaetes bacterium GWF1_51_8]|nr:MAG: DNA primase [Spirochaetes bacterium GWF1_51_8]
MIPQNVIDEILTRVSISELIGQFIEVKKSSNRNHLALCPFHNEKSPSFSISDDKGLYHCFGCGASGNAITFLKEFRKLTFREALDDLAKIAGIDLDKFGDEAESADSRQKERIYSLHSDAAKYFHRNLMDPKGTDGGSIARDYLKGRKITGDMVKMFRLGYGGSSWNGLIEHLRGEGYNEEEMLAASVAAKTEKGFFNRFKDRVIFPIFDIRDKVIAFGGRILTDDKTSAKYLNSGETAIFHKGNQLFALNFAKEEISRSSHALVVEGYMDVIALYQNGIKNSVAPLGTALTENQLVVLKRFCENVTFVFDGDDAGVKAADRAIDLTATSGTDINHWVVILPNKMDPYDFSMKNGGQAFTDFVGTNRLSPIDFKIRYYSRKVGAEANKLKFLFHIFSYIEKLRSAVLRQGALKSAADFLKLETEIIKEEYNSFLNKRPMGQFVRKQNKDNSPAIDPLELDYLATVISKPELLDEMARVVEPEMFVSPEYRELYEALLADTTRSTQAILSNVTDKPLMEKVSHYSMSPEYNPGYISAYRLRAKYVRSRVEALRREVTVLEKRLPKDEEIDKRINEIRKEMQDWGLEQEEIKSFISKSEIEKI